MDTEKRLQILQNAMERIEDEVDGLYRELEAIKTLLKELNK